MDISPLLLPSLVWAVLILPFPPTAGPSSCTLGCAGKRGTSPWLWPYVREKVGRKVGSGGLQVGNILLFLFSFRTVITFILGGKRDFICVCVFVYEHLMTFQGIRQKLNSLDWFCQIIK